MPDQNARMLEEGLRLLERRDLHAAMSWFKQVVVDDANNGQAYACLGIALCSLGRAEDGVQALNRSAELLPNDATAQYNAGVGLLCLQCVDDARDAFRRATTIDPRNGAAQAALARLQAPGTSGAAPSATAWYQPFAPATSQGAQTTPPAVTDPAALGIGFQLPGAAGQALRGAIATGETQTAPPVADARTSAGPPVSSVAPQPVVRADDLADWTPPPAAAREARRWDAARALAALGWGALYGQAWTLASLTYQLMFDVMLRRPRLLQTLAGAGLDVPRAAAAGAAAALIVTLTGANAALAGWIGLAAGLLAWGVDPLTAGGIATFVIACVIGWWLGGAVRRRIFSAGTR